MKATISARAELTSQRDFDEVLDALQQTLNDLVGISLSLSGGVQVRITNAWWEEADEEEK